MSRRPRDLVTPTVAAVALAVLLYWLAVGAPHASRVADDTRRPPSNGAPGRPGLTEPDPGASAPRPAKTYRVDWRRRALAEKAHRLRSGERYQATIARLEQRVAVLEHARAVQAHEPASVDWRAKQIAAAETIGREAAADPWPNCPDPIWNGAASWDVTVACENGGSWLDSPGFYRCGLQFDPMWERRFGELCP